jgi:thiol-disulfide isomerase/thioredoxin
MAPMVHGLEEEYRGRIDFVYLDVSDPAVRRILPAFGFKATPHFFLRTPDGRIAWSRQGLAGEQAFRQAFAGVLDR